MSKITKRITKITEETKEISGFECEGPCNQAYYEDEGVEKHTIVKDPSLPNTASKKGVFPEDLADYIEFFQLSGGEPIRMIGQKEPVDYVGTYDPISLGEAIHIWKQSSGGPSRKWSRTDFEAATAVRKNNLEAMFRINIPVTASIGDTKTICEYCWEAIFDE